MIGSIFLMPQQEIQAQTCNYLAGRALGGEVINVDLCSISRANSVSVNFTYYLAKEKIVSQANCVNGTWITFPEKGLYRPQSKATQQMLNVVCNYKYSTNNLNSRRVDGFVFDPPSNVRISPNGEILCSVKTSSDIQIYGSIGSWFYTDICGTMGVIHSSQVRF